MGFLKSIRCTHTHTLWLSVQVILCQSPQLPMRQHVAYIFLKLFKEKILSTSFLPFIYSFLINVFVFICEVQCYISVYVFVGSWLVQSISLKLELFLFGEYAQISFFSLLWNIHRTSMKITFTLLFIGFQILFFLSINGMWPWDNIFPPPPHPGLYFLSLW